MGKDVMEERTALLLFVISSTVFFASTSGIYSSNDGSHLALAKSIYHNHTFTINSFAYLTGGIDYSTYNGDIYSDRAPGMALAIIPFYALGNVFSGILPMPAYYRGWEGGDSRMFLTFLLTNMAGGVCVLLVYLTAKRLGAQEHGAVVAALTAGFGTLVWKYSIKMYSHSLSAALCMLALYLAVTLTDLRKQRIMGYALFGVLGYLPLLEYPNAILSVVFLAYLFLSRKIRVVLDETNMKAIACFMVPALLIPFYNFVNFGNPLTPAYVYSPHHAWVADLTDSGPIVEGILGLTLSNEWGGSKLGADGGVFLLSPALLLGVLGFVTLYRKRKYEVLLIFALFILHLIFYGRFKTWWGGGDFDTRYMLAVTVPLAIGVAFWMDDLVGRLRCEFMKTLFQGITWVLIAFSIVGVAEDVSQLEGPKWRYFDFPAVHPSDISTTVDAVFPNMWRIPVYFGLVAIAYAISSAVLKRLPGLSGRDVLGLKKDHVIFGLFICGLILILLFSSQPKMGYSVRNLRYSDNLLEWYRGTPPYTLKGDTMYVKGVVDVSGMGKVVLDVSAKDCIRKVYVNERMVEVIKEGECSPCMHCAEGKMDITPYLRMDGQNLIGFEIQGVGDTSEFNVK
ncbi:MAG: hypothetical protein KKD39_01965 [Candidatus Altiarchaeota archaeon]|nr:hypothetical protein [Candidatus Altiarchaeota archaeon]